MPEHLRENTLFFTCKVLENIHTALTEGIGISREVGSSLAPKDLKKCMKIKLGNPVGCVRGWIVMGGGMDIFWNYTTGTFSHTQKSTCIRLTIQLRTV